MNNELYEEKVSTEGNFKNFFSKPSVFFENNKQKSPWLIVFLLIIISTAIYKGESISGKAELIANLVTDNFLKGGQSVDTTISVVSKIGAVVAGISAAIESLTTVLIASLVIFLCVKFILKGKISFKQVLSIYCFANIPNIIFINIIKIAKNFIDNKAISTAIKVIFATPINPLTIWSVVLLIIGISVVAKVSIKKTTVLLVGLKIITLWSAIVTIGKYIIQFS